MQQKSNLTDVQIQTEPPCLNMFDTPPSEQQFEENSPSINEPSSNIYLPPSTIHMGIEIETNINQMEQEVESPLNSKDDVSHEKEITTSDSEKENSYDIERDFNNINFGDEAIKELSTSIDIANDTLENEYLQNEMHEDTESTSTCEPMSVSEINDNISEENTQLDSPPEPINETTSTTTSNCLKVIIEKVETISDDNFVLSERNYLLEKQFITEEHDSDFEEGPLNNPELPEEVNENFALPPRDIEEEALVCSFVDSPNVNFATNEIVELPEVAHETEISSHDDTIPISNIQEVASPTINNNIISPEKIIAVNGIKEVPNDNIIIENKIENGKKTINCNVSVINPPIPKNDNAVSNPVTNKVTFTSAKTVKECDFNKFELMCREFSDTYGGLGEVLSGPVTKLNGSSVSQVGSFDLFGPNTDWGSNRKPPEETSVKSYSTSERSSSQCSSPIEASPSYQDVDIADFKNHVEKQLSNGLIHPSFKLAETNFKPTIPTKKVQKTVAIQENNNRIYNDDRNEEDIERIYGKKIKIQKPKYNTESSYIRQIRKKDKRLQLKPVVVIDKLTTDELLRKYQCELEIAMLGRAKLDIKKHNTTRSCILMKMSFNKEEVKPNDEIMPQNYLTAGTVQPILSFPNCNYNKPPSNNSAEPYTENPKPEKVHALNLSLPPVHHDSDTSLEFSNSPKFLQNCDQIINNCLCDKSTEESSSPVAANINFLSNNSNFYQHNNVSGKSDNNSPSNVDIMSSDVKENTHSEHNSSEDSDEIDILNLSDESEILNTLLKSLNSQNDWRLPVKKRRMSVALKDEVKEEISYPATPMISIAEVEALQNSKINNANRSFKTPAERKEMPPLPKYSIITDQFHNHTYNNPTINYHMSNVPIPFINLPCAPYYPISPLLFPFNNVPNTFANLQDPKLTTKVNHQHNTAKGRQKKEGIKGKHHSGGYCSQI